ncbi:hypothetical protein [Dyadobacter sp. 676]|uniref:SDR family NAD(P)-dependent oxidoreductase n=1 Tax=Dyadobacter sp. 676 TaxID=3088362 RepID=A0AAU8FUN4_9BACT
MILIGTREAALETLVRDIVQNYRVLVHYRVVDDADTGSIISACEKINEGFEVDMLINYTETGWSQRLDDYDVWALDRKLKTSHASGILYLHQLLPNLLLYAHSRVINIWCHSQPLPVWEQALMAFNMRFAGHLDAELNDAGLRIHTIALPVYAGKESADRVAEILA